jgi:hypothetical protein
LLEWGCVCRCRAPCGGMETPSPTPSGWFYGTVVSSARVGQQKLCYVIMLYPENGKSQHKKGWVRIGRRPIGPPTESHRSRGPMSALAGVVQGDNGPVGVRCLPRGMAYTNITFDNAVLVQSNLGGQGGRCVTRYNSAADVTTSWRDLCLEAQPGVNHTDAPFVPHVPPSPGRWGNQHVLLQNLGVKQTYDGNGVVTRSDQLWLLISNESEYRAWNPRPNGVKRTSWGTMTGSFGAINLLGPRSSTSRPANKFWHSEVTIVQLRYNFVTEKSAGSYYSDSTGARGLRPLDVGRIIFSFWDVDMCACSPQPACHSVVCGSGRSV